MRIVSSTQGENLVDIETINKFDADDVLYFYDVFDEQLVISLIDQKGRPRYILGDSLSFIEIPCIDIPIYTVNLWLEWELRRFKNVNLPSVADTTYVANFIINKKQINRYLTVKLCELFDLDTNYTWSGIGRSFDLSPIIDELNHLADTSFVTEYERGFLLAPISSESRWISSPTDEFDESSVTGYGDNTWTWNNGINDIVSTSAISLISESVDFQRGIHFSEKTAYSVLGLTFPIWIGGYRQADEWKKIGFDVFDDIIDHSYQYKNTLIERCWCAFKLNLDLLCNKQKLAELRQQHLPRLLKNRDLLLSDRLKCYNDSIIMTWPGDLRDSISPVLDLFRAQ